MATKEFQFMVTSAESYKILNHNVHPDISIDPPSDDKISNKQVSNHGIRDNEPIFIFKLTANQQALSRFIFKIEHEDEAGDENVGQADLSTCSILASTGDMWRHKGFEVTNREGEITGKMNFKYRLVKENDGMLAPVLAPTPAKKSQEPVSDKSTWLTISTAASKGNEPVFDDQDQTKAPLPANEKLHQLYPPVNAYHHQPQAPYVATSVNPYTQGSGNRPGYAGQYQQVGYAWPPANYYPDQGYAGPCQHGGYPQPPASYYPHQLGSGYGYAKPFHQGTGGRWLHGIQGTTSALQGAYYAARTYNIMADGRVPQQQQVTGGQWLETLSFPNLIWTLRLENNLTEKLMRKAMIDGDVCDS